jgi:hypothetical protein
MESKMKRFFKRAIYFVIANMIALSAAHANAAEMPQVLTGQWCQVSVRDNFIKAKNACKETRPMIYVIHRFGFFVKLADVKIRALCVPLETQAWRNGWMVLADCGADDNSSSVQRFEFTFEFDGSDKAVISSRSQ